MNLHQGQFKYRLPEDFSRMVYLEIERSPGFFAQLVEVGPHILDARKAADGKLFQGWPEIYAIKGDNIEMHPTPHTTGDFKAIYTPKMKEV